MKDAFIGSRIDEVDITIPRIAPKQLMISRDSKHTFTLHNLSPDCKVTVNGKILVADLTHQLNHGDEFTVDARTFRFEATPDTPQYAANANDEAKSPLQIGTAKQEAPSPSYPAPADESEVVQPVQPTPKRGRQTRQSKAAEGAAIEIASEAPPATPSSYFHCFLHR